MDASTKENYADETILESQNFKINLTFTKSYFYFFFSDNNIKHQPFQEYYRTQNLQSYRGKDGMLVHPNISRKCRIQYRSSLYITATYRQLATTQKTAKQLCNGCRISIKIIEVGRTLGIVLLLEVMEGPTRVGAGAEWGHMRLPTTPKVLVFASLAIGEVHYFFIYLILKGNAILS